MAKADFLQFMVAHEAAFVNISIDATEVALASILPYEVVLAVF